MKEIRPEDYVDLDAEHPQPDLIPMVDPATGARTYIEIPMTRRDWCHKIAYWYGNDFRNVPAGTLEGWGLTEREFAEAAMDASKIVRDAREAADLARHYYFARGSAEKPDAEEKP
jgi:hypothetical protein